MHYWKRKNNTFKNWISVFKISFVSNVDISRFLILKLNQKIFYNSDTECDAPILSSKIGLDDESP